MDFLQQFNANNKAIALFKAVAYQNIEKIKLLLQQGVSANTKAPYKTKIDKTFDIYKGQPVLHFAVGLFSFAFSSTSDQQKEILQLLIDNGADLNEDFIPELSQESSGFILRRSLCNSQYNDSFTKYMIDTYGEKINAVNSTGKSRLDEILSMRPANIAVVKFLFLDKSSNPSAGLLGYLLRAVRNTDIEKTVLDECIKREFSLEKIFAELSAEPKDNTPNTPMLKYLIIDKNIAPPEKSLAAVLQAVKDTSVELKIVLQCINQGMKIKTKANGNILHYIGGIKYTNKLDFHDISSMTDIIETYKQELSKLISQQDKNGHTPLKIYVNNSTPNIMFGEFLLDNHATIQNADIGEYLLHDAAKVDGATLGLLLKHGGKHYLDNQDNSGKTPIMCAALAGQHENVVALVEAGADLSIKNNKRSLDYYISICEDKKARGKIATYFQVNGKLAPCQAPMATLVPTLAMG